MAKRAPRVLSDKMNGQPSTAARRPAKLAAAKKAAKAEKAKATLLAEMRQLRQPEPQIELVFARQEYRNEIVDFVLRNL